MGDATLKFERAGWSEAAAARLATIGDAQEADLANWQAQVSSGAMTLLKVRWAGEVIGFVIWCIEQEPTRRAIIINAAAIDPVKEVDMTAALERFGRDMGERHAAQVLRFWTSREGLVRKLATRFSKTYVMEAQI